MASTTAWALAGVARPAFLTRGAVTTCRHGRCPVQRPTIRVAGACPPRTDTTRELATRFPAGRRWSCPRLLAPGGQPVPSSGQQTRR
jgi:hypothetical protein